MYNIIKKNILLLLLIISSFLFAENIRISQIDPSSLLLNQKIKIYISITSDKGIPVKSMTPELFQIFESDNNQANQIKRNILYFNPSINYETGIKFLLLIDNSKSMYKNMNGNETDKAEKMRINLAKQAVYNLLLTISNPKDKVGVAVYNSYYKLISKPLSDLALISRAMKLIHEPDDSTKWTEIYSSLDSAIRDIHSERGRKAIIILSDGENMPHYKWAGTLHDTLGTNIIKYTSPIESALKEGISIFAINFGTRLEKKDQNLSKIALQTGGITFNAYNPEELKNVYSHIIDLILNEYYIEYKATTLPGNKRHITAKFLGSKAPIQTSRYYFSDSLFGKPGKINFIFYIAAIILSLIILYLITKLKFVNKNQNASLEILEMNRGKASTKLFNINQNKTIISNSKNADLTVIDPAQQSKSQTIIEYDKAKNQYTLISDETITVNNKKRNTKILEPGDVIQSHGATIIFDEGVIKKKT